MSELTDAFRAEWTRRKHLKLVEMAPLTIQLLEALIREVEPIEHVRERARFLLSGYREVEALARRELR